MNPKTPINAESIKLFTNKDITIDNIPPIRNIGQIFFTYIIFSFDNNWMKYSYYYKGTKSNDYSFEIHDTTFSLFI
ncbi:hypothetical protein [Methanobrevibacter arboriphilus]|nr:hypothetical protein [Methanobrevibacter arboriphilus]